MSETAVFKIHIDGPLEAVWREVTKTHEVQRAMFNMRLDGQLAVGAPIRYQSANGKYTGIVGEVLELEPMTRYVHTFQFTSYDDPPCRVAHELREVNGGVEYVMTCTELPPNTKSTKQMVQGGHMIARNLKSLVERGRVPFGTALLYGLFRVMEPFSPAKLRSENWPLRHAGGVERQAQER